MSYRVSLGGSLAIGIVLQVDITQSNSGLIVTQDNYYGLQLAPIIMIQLGASALVMLELADDDDDDDATGLI